MVSVIVSYYTSGIKSRSEVAVKVILMVNNIHGMGVYRYRCYTIYMYLKHVVATCTREVGNDAVVDHLLQICCTIINYSSVL